MRVTAIILVVVAVGLAAEPGFEPLFDGKSLQGWALDPRPQPSGLWLVHDGELTVEGKPGNLVSDRTFADFDLRLEWKVGPQGNSGVFYRVPLEGRREGSRLAIEYQLADNARSASQQNPDRRAGSPYGLYAPSAKADRPPGQWNTLRIVAKCTQVQHWLNGVLVAEFEVGSEDYRRRAQAKFPQQKDFGEAPEGRIVLQDHGSAVWFRNLRIRDLSGETVP